MGMMGKPDSPENEVSAPAGALTWCFLERMTRFELATLTLARLWSPSVQSVYCCAVPHSPQNRPGNPSRPSSSYTGLPSHARYVLSLPSG